MRVEVLSGVERRRQWSDAEKARIVAETLAPGARVADEARRNAVSASLVLGWRRLARDGLLGQGVPPLMPVAIVPPAPALPCPALPAPAPLVTQRPKRSAGIIEIELSQVRRLPVCRAPTRPEDATAKLRTPWVSHCQDEAAFTSSHHNYLP